MNETELVETIAVQIDHGRLNVAIVHMVSTILAMFPNIFLIVVLAKYQVLKTSRNILIMNWAIIDLITQLSNIDKVNLLYFSITGHEGPSLVLDGLLSLFLMCHFYKNALLLMFFTDCCYKKLTVPRLQRVIPLLWIIFCCICLPIIALSVIYRNLNGCIWSSVVMFLILIVVFAVKTFMYLIRMSSKPLLQNIRYILTSCYIAALIVYMTGLILIFGGSVGPYVCIFMMVGFVFYPFVIIFVLYQLDSNFKQCVRQLFKKNNFSGNVTYPVGNEDFSEVL